MKSFADYIRPHEESICKSIVNLLVTCSDSVTIRKVNIDAFIFLIFSWMVFPFIITKLKVLGVGVVGSLKTCSWNWFQEGIISLDWHAFGREVIFWTFWWLTVISLIWKLYYLPPLSTPQTFFFKIFLSSQNCASRNMKYICSLGLPQGFHIC